MRTIDIDRHCSVCLLGLFLLFQFCSWLLQARYDQPSVKHTEESNLVVRSRQSPNLFDCAGRFADSDDLKEITSRRIPVQYPHFLDIFQTQTAEVAVPVCGFLFSAPPTGDESVLWRLQGVVLRCALQGPSRLLSYVQALSGGVRSIWMWERAAGKLVRRCRGSFPT